MYNTHRRHHNSQYQVPADINMKSTRCLLFLLLIPTPGCALQISPIERRSFLASSATLLISQLVHVSNAESADLASTLYNPDGSLRDDVVKEATERLVSFSWDVEEQGIRQTDGKSDAASSGQVQVSYKLPDKWISNEKGMYIDPSEGMLAKATDHIYVYQAPGLVKPKDLERASTIGVGKVLQVIPELERVNGADLLSGRKTEKQQGQMYYEFDMASAPKACGDSEQNLGLGFCPFDRVYLLSATISDEGRLYVLCVECDSTEWKQASADLKRVRSSFSVVTATA